MAAELSRLNKALLVLNNSKYDKSNTPPWCPSPVVSSGRADRSARSRAPSCPASFLCGGWTNEGQRSRGGEREKKENMIRITWMSLILVVHTVWSWHEINEEERRRIGSRGVKTQRASQGTRWWRADNRSFIQTGSYVCDDGDAQVSHVGDDLTVLRGDLSVLDQLVQVLLRDAWTHFWKKKKENMFWDGGEFLVYNLSTKQHHFIKTLYYINSIAV